MDRQRLEAFVHDEYPRVVAAVGFACGDRGRAEDAVQEVLAAALGYEGPVEHLRAWVVTSALNRVRSTARRDGAERRALERWLRPRRDQHTTVAEQQDDVLAELAALPARQREITALHYLLDLSVADIAASLDVSEGTVKTQLHRARATLRARLEPGHDDEEVDHVGR
ncbi:MAG: RNA polymerase sigma factor [Microthrixaceae bacterium]